MATMTGTIGNDLLSGAVGDVVIYGNLASDTLLGDAGVDTLYGGQGDDTIWTGDSVRSSDHGADLAYGGEGNDLIIILEDRPMYFADLYEVLRPRSIYGDTGNDTIDASAVDTAVGRRRPPVRQRFTSSTTAARVAI